MSKIPRKSNIASQKGSKVGTSVLHSSNIPIHFARKSAGAPSKKDIFKAHSFVAKLSERILPEEIRTRPRLYGKKEQVDILYDYTRSLAEKIFEPFFYNQLFPKVLVAFKDAYTYQSSMNPQKPASRIPMARRSSIAPGVDLQNTELNMEPPFKTLSDLIVSSNKKIMKICDFCMLYSGVILLIVDRVDIKMLAMNFLKQILHQPDLPNRTSEFSILFSVLIRQHDSSLIHSTSETFALLCQHDKTVEARVRAAIEYHDADIAKLCQLTCQLLPNSSGIPLQDPSFAAIPRGSSEETAVGMLKSFCDLIGTGMTPPDPLEFMKNVIETMNRFPISPAVLEHGSVCVRHVFVMCDPLPVEIACQILDICFAVLSGECFLPGGESFDAVEAVQSLFNEIFAKANTNIILGALSSLISTTNEARLPFIMNKLKEYVRFAEPHIDQKSLDDISIALDAFHPTFTERPDFLRSRGRSSSVYDEMAESIRRLTDPETVFEEMEAIIARNDPLLIQRYPIYLRGFLQRAYFLYSEIEPIGMTETDRELANQMMKNYRGMTEADLQPGGRFSYDTLSGMFEEIKSASRQAW